MNTISEGRLTFDSNRMIFAKNALFAALILLVVFNLEGMFTSQNMKALAIYFTFTPVAAGISGIILIFSRKLNKNPKSWIVDTWIKFSMHWTKPCFQIKYSPFKFIREITIFFT